MNRIIVFFFTLIALFGASASNDPVQDKESKEEAINIAASLLSALNDYKNEQRDLCLSELTNQLSFKLVKDVTHEVPKNCTVDSLVVGNDELQRWGYFKTVDLDYLKDVEALVTLKTAQSGAVADALADILKRNGLQISKLTADTYHFVDTLGGYVIDDRFKVKVKSRVSSRYNYSIQVMDDYIILEVKEVVSENWVTSNDILAEDIKTLADK